MQRSAVENGEGFGRWKKETGGVMGGIQKGCLSYPVCMCSTVQYSTVHSFTALGVWVVYQVVDLDGQVLWGYFSPWFIEAAMQ